MEREGDVCFGAGVHQGGGCGDVPAKGDDTVEVVKRNTEFALPFVADFNGCPVFAQVGVLKGDEEGV